MFSLEAGLEVRFIGHQELNREPESHCQRMNQVRVSDNAKLARVAAA